MQSAVDCGGICASAAAELGVGCGNRAESCGLIEEASVAAIVGVDAEEVVEIDIAEVIDAENHAGPDLVLETRVHLYGVGRFVAGRERAEEDCRASRDQSRNVVGIGRARDGRGR